MKIFLIVTVMISAAASFAQYGGRDGAVPLPTTSQLKWAIFHSSNSTDAQEIIYTVANRCCRQNAIESGCTERHKHLIKNFCYLVEQ